MFYIYKNRHIAVIKFSKVVKVLSQLPLLFYESNQIALKEAELYICSCLKRFAWLNENKLNFGQQQRA